MSQLRRRCMPLLLSTAALLSASLSANAFSISYVRSVTADGKRLSPTSSARGTTAASGNDGASTLSNAELKEELLKRIETLVSVFFSMQTSVHDIVWQNACMMLEFMMFY